MPADTSVMVNISEMIDLAIGTPEVGIVDFNMLQTVLHCLAQQLRVLGKQVELRGSVAALPVYRPQDATQTIAVSEFTPDPKVPGTFELVAEPPPPADMGNILVVERIRKQPQDTYTPGNETREGTPVPGAQGGGLGPASQVSGPTSKVTGPTGQVTGPAGQGTGSGGQVTGPGGQVTGPGGQAMEPGGQSSTGQAVTGSTTGPPSGITRQEGAAPARMPSMERLGLVTVSKFNVLENVVDDIKNRVYGAIPKNEEILEEVRSQSNLKAITDMWNNLNVSSRLEAAEEGIGKLSSLVEDLIGETVEMQKAAGGQPSAAASKIMETAKSVTKEAKTHVGVGGLSRTGTQSAAGEQSRTGTPSAAAAPGATGAQGPPGESTVIIQAAPSGTATVTPSAATVHLPANVATRDELMQTLNHVQNLRHDFDVLTKTFYDTMKDMNEKFEPPKDLPMPSKTEPVMVTIKPPVPPAVNVSPSALAPDPSAGAGVGGGASVTHDYAPAGQPSGTISTTGNLVERLNDLEKKLAKCCDTMYKSDGLVKDQLNSFQDQLENLQKQIVGINQESLADGGKLSPDLAKDLQGLMQLFQTVQQMQAQLQSVHDTALQLAAEKEDRQNHIDALLEQIELLKTIKLDREDMVEALADKADLRMLARKVSHDQFETACDDLAKGLEHALGKLNVQEALWQQALDDIQREIETKLDKMELSPVKEFFNNKLKQLQDNLKQMAALRREAEAAGTKSRLLRDVNCISCDAKAVMSMDPPSPMPPKPLPATLSMKPYLSYELDAIRKSQASSLPHRNMHDWEHIDKQMQPRQPYKVRSDTDKHLCNRYCGGSHTVTTPAQRVARLGHFIKQWGPEVLPLSSGYAAGDDGRLYKISTPAEGAAAGPGGAVEGAATCTPKSPVKKSETPKGPKPLVTSAECRCLEPPDRPAKN